MQRTRLVFLGSVLALFCFAGIASSKEGGITGKSGKQGSICNSCHNNLTGAKVPTVKIEGPTSLDAGAVAEYIFRMQTDASTTGMNAAATDGVVLDAVDGGNAQLDFDEVTHAGPKKPDASTGEVLYAFTVKAPAYGGPITIYAAGNACNGDNQEEGDESAGTTLAVTVNGPPKPVTPPADGGTTKPNLPTTVPSPPSDSGVSTTPSDAGTKDTPAAADDSGCSIGFADQSSLPAGALFAGLAGLALVTRARRKRR